MVDDRIGALCAAPCVIAGAGRGIGTRTGADEPADDIVAGHTHFVVFQRDAGAAGRGLSGDRDIALAEDIALELDRAADIEYNDDESMIEPTVMSEADFNASELADEALSKDLNPVDPVEWLPAVEAYTQTGRMDDALDIVQKMRSDEVLAYNACYYFRSKENRKAYDEIIPILCGGILERESAAETDEHMEEAVTDIPGENSDKKLSDEMPAAETSAEISEKAPLITDRELEEETDVL